MEALSRASAADARAAAAARCAVVPSGLVVVSPQIVPPPMPCVDLSAISGSTTAADIGGLPPRSHESGRTANNR
ncbi:hypothetical protein [Frankia gtarii]|uniref:hypothetical protein n=1 Tax=Frankia gtarii TaxID=2950102 RepID=UPI0021BFFECE|nr:hypothetical protein [Frankia gtarii]